MRAFVFVSISIGALSTLACSGSSDASSSDGTSSLAGSGGASGAAAGTGGKGGGTGGNAGSGTGGKGGSAAGGSAGTAGTGGANGGSSGASGGGGVTGGSSGSSGTGGASGGKGGAGGATAGNGGTVGGSGGLGGGASGASAGGSGGAGGACSLLRIGIIGNPGANPSSDFQTFVKALGTSTARVNTMPTDTFDPALLAGFDVVILDRLARPYTAAEANTLRTWVEAGGGVVSMSGYANSAAPDFYANPLLAPFGLSYGGPLISGPANNFVMHPTTAGLTSVTFAGGYEVTSTPVAGGTSTAIAGIGSTWIGYVHQRSMGRAFVWGDEWIEFDSEWSTMPQIKQLWVNVLTWVGPSGHCALKP
jgi:hypothetical protein